MLLSYRALPFLLLLQFDDVMIYLKSVEQYQRTRRDGLPVRRFDLLSLSPLAEYR